MGGGRAPGMWWAGEEGCAQGRGRVTVGKGAVVHRAAVACGPVGEGKGGVMDSIAGDAVDCADPCVLMESSIALVVTSEGVRSDGREGG